jgi:hypothetical protein
MRTAKSLFMSSIQIGRGRIRHAGTTGGFPHARFRSTGSHDRHPFHRGLSRKKRSSEER